LTLLQPVFVGILCVGFVLAGAHFITMLATRWGERRVSSKALLFSLAVHLSMGCGLVAMIPEYRGQLLQFLEEEASPIIEVQTVVYEGLQEAPASQAGNTPIWDELSQPQIEELTRYDRILQPLEPDQGPPPRPEPVELDQRRLKDITVLPDQPAELPEQQLAAIEGIQQQAVLPLTSPTPETMRRDEVSTPQTERDRIQLGSPVSAAESALDKPKFGAVDRLRPDFVAEPDLSTIKAPVEEVAELTPRDDETDIENREGPAPASPELAETGQIAQPDPSTTEGHPTPHERTRTTARSPATPNDSLPTRQRLESLPRDPRPQDEDPLASLTGTIRDADRPPVVPQLERQNFNPQERSDLNRLPATYQLRSTDEDRKLATRQFGGTEESEQAVEAALKWLASTQHPDGYWDASEYGAGTGPESTAAHMRPNTGGDADTGVTALAVLAFLGAGHTPEHGAYAGTVRRAMVWLIQQQAKDGYLGGNADFVAGMYCHGMATFALAEALAMMADTADTAWLRQPLMPAVEYIIANQTPDGSWRYVGRDNKYGDMSMFGWQLMALKSAETGGIPVRRETVQQMVRFLNDMSRGQSGGLAAYRSTDAVSPTMTAEALFCKQMLGLRRSHASGDEAIRYLMQHLPSRTSMNYYYWYYGTLATFQYGGEPWRRWNEEVRDLLVSEQLPRGRFAGSWEPRGEWGPYVGRVYTTALAALCLEVYYRYLPLYKAGGRYDVPDEAP
jgi:hypothetical protein